MKSNLHILSDIINCAATLSCRMIQVTASDCNCFLAGGIISAPHVLKIVGAVGEGQNAELPVPLAALR